MKKKIIFLYDASAFFSGKPIIFFHHDVVTTSLIEKEFQPGGRDYRNFQLLKEQGLQILDPSHSSVNFITDLIKKFGEQKRLSPADISLLSLAYDFLINKDSTPVIITDDYSIQNIADQLGISYQSMNQSGITKRFKWERRCRGCGKKIVNDVDVCPICGSSIKHVIKKTSPVEKK